MTIKTYGTPLFSYIRAIQFHCRVTTQVRPHTHKWSELIGWHFWGVRLQTDTNPHNCHRQLTVRPALFFTVLFCKIYYKSKAAKLSAPLFGTGLIIIESRTYNANCCYCIMYASWSRTSSISIIAEPRKLFIKCIVKNRTIKMCLYASHNFYMREILIFRSWNTHW